MARPPSRIRWASSSPPQTLNSSKEFNSMSSIAGKHFERTHDEALIKFLGYKWIHNFDLTLPPRVKQSGANTASPTALFNPTLEVIGDATTDPTACAFPEGKGLQLITAGNDHDPCLLMPLLGLAALISPFVNGHATARTSCSIGNAFKTGAATATDSGKGIEFAAVVSQPQIVTKEVMVGMSGPTIALVGPDLLTGTPGYLDPTDGFYFMYNAEVGPNWYACVNNAAGDELFNTGVPAVAARNVLLSAELTKDRRPVFKINGNTVHRGEAVDAATKVCPFISLKSLTDSAMSLDIMGWRVGRQW